MSLEHIEKERQLQNKLADQKLKAHTKYALKNLLERQSILILSLLPDAGNVLEIGCGLGDFMEFIGKKNNKIHALGIDPSDKTVELANRRIKPYKENLKVKTGAAETLTEDLKDEFEHTAYSVAVMRGVVHHLSNIAKSFEEIFKLLNPGGNIIIFEGNVDCPYRKIALGLADLFGVQHEASEFPHTPSNELVEILTRIGFVNIKLQYVSGFFAPLSYVGFGGKAFWNLAGKIDILLSRLFPRFFGWWFLIEAEKPPVRD